jgi:hypothetical protein
MERRTDRINAKIREILEGCALSHDPAARVLEHIERLLVDHTWGTKEIEEVEASTLFIVDGLRGGRPTASRGDA